jgi:ParB/RepB/Spo0J family partition protein
MSTGIKLKHFPFSELRLEPNPRPRESISDAEIDETAGSVLQHGIIQPALARMRDGHPYIYAGQCRYLGFERALQRAKSGEECHVDLTEFPVLIREIDDRTMHVHQWIENLQRKGVHPRDEVRGFAELRDTYGMTLEEVGHKIGKTESYMKSRMALINIPDSLWRAFDDKKVTISHLEIAGSIPHAKDREEFGRLISGGQYGDRPSTVKEAQELKNSTFVKELSACGFDKTDASLVGIEHKDGVRVMGGACVGCEYLTQTGRRQRCSNVRCFNAKQDAAFHAIQENAAQSGRRAMDVDQTAALFDDTGELLESSGFVDLGGVPLHLETGHFNEDDVTPWEELLEGTQAAALAVMARNPRTNRVHQLLEREDAIRLAIENDAKAAKIFENRPGAKKSRQGDPETFRLGEGETERHEVTTPGGGDLFSLDGHKDDDSALEMKPAEEPQMPDFAILQAKLELLEGAGRKLVACEDVDALCEFVALHQIARAPVSALRLVISIISETPLDETAEWSRDACLRIINEGDAPAADLIVLTEMALQLVRGEETAIRFLTPYAKPQKGEKKKAEPEKPNKGGKLSHEESVFSIHLANDDVITSEPNKHGVLVCCSSARMPVEKKGFAEVSWGVDVSGQWYSGYRFRLPQARDRKTIGAASPCKEIYATRGEAIMTALLDMRDQIAGAGSEEGEASLLRVMMELKTSMHWQVREGPRYVPAKAAPEAEASRPKGITASQRKALAKQDVKTKKAHGGVPEVDPKVKAKARKLYDEGMGKDKIAEKLGISPNTVGNWQKREWPKRKAK